MVFFCQRMDIYSETYRFSLFYCWQVEEYDATTDQLLLRKVRKEAPAGRPAAWEIELGEDEALARGGDALIIASSDQPSIVRLDTKDSFQAS
jgi:hypothetical protein